MSCEVLLLVSYYTTFERKIKIQYVKLKFRPVVWGQAGGTLESITHQKLQRAESLSTQPTP